jgi:hypothetical protein
MPQLKTRAPGRTSRASRMECCDAKRPRIEQRRFDHNWRGGRVVYCGGLGSRWSGASTTSDPQVRILSPPIRLR